MAIQGALRAGSKTAPCRKRPTTGFRRPKASTRTRKGPRAY